MQITAGKDKGQQGVISKVIRDDRVPRVIVEGRNLVKRHIKRTEGNPGGIITTESPLHYSNVQVVDPVTKAPVRLTWRFLEDGTKVRVTRGKKASGSIVPRPEILKQRRKPRPLPGPKDTPFAEVARQTMAEGGAPLHPHFTAGILRPPEGARAFSTGSGAALGRTWSSLAAQLSAYMPGRQHGISWRGFAASCSTR